ncbi:glycosyltransferase family 8 protein [Wielerella bovis]|uniref:glycosyltransferase family 8 protein n=1 Tax=Wielerella bovis TaxID=2917790 RepID=UPI002019D643|nr:glycosyltransferase family 8 protein [Wielerella bovis]MCG7657184.1 glycosyltransferase family 8 protein [Wielerella bovis]MCG7659407.1 glycosyltransferase family 8 protein [Wielerella bovis]
MMPHTLNIVLADDNAYAPHVETLLKSLCCHNRQMRVYLFHRNSHAPEWFDYINQQLHNFDSEIISAVVSQTQLDHYPNQSHITSAAYYRFLMATLPHDRALYLDSDLLVTGSLQSLYQMQFSGCLLAAVQDSVTARIDWRHPYNLHQQPYFNSGVLLADLTQWRRENIQQKLLDTAQKIAHNVPFGDQCILNYVCQNRWFPLPEHYNYQAGTEWLLANRGLSRKFSPPKNLPLIVHYTTPQKPWLLNTLPEHLPPPAYRQLYWKYRQLSWADVRAVAQNI